jgi:adenylate cyclase class 2
MGKEYEAKFLDIDVDKLRDKIIKHGGMIVHENEKYVRSVFRLCNTDKKGYARVRDEAGKVTITVKIYNNPDYPDEYEIETVNDFETAKNLLVAMNLQVKSFQESYREKWSLPNKEVHEVTFDTIPGIPTYMEIDCVTEKALKDTIKLLELDKGKMRYGAFDRVYKEYYDIEHDTINYKTPSLTFKNIINEIKPIKNHDLLKKIYKKQNSGNNNFSKQNALYYKKYRKYKLKYFKSLKYS